MKVILTHGYFLYDDPKEQSIMRPYPPLGILYISAYLKQNNINVEVFDTTFSNKDKFKNFIINSKSNVVAFYVNLMTKLNVLELTKWIKSQPDLEHLKIIFGGPDITYNTVNYLKSGADFVVFGEGEETMLEIVTALKNNLTTFENIPGLAYLNNKGEEIKNSPRTKIKDIDSLPFPDRKAIDLNLYQKAWKDFHGQSTISISTQRGCPYTCKWCSTAVYGQSYRRRSPKLVVDELQWIIENYNPDTFWFVDDVFTVSHKWLSDFETELNKRNITISFECISRADRLNPEVLNILKSAGCFRIWIGAESGSQKIIDKMDRRVDVNHVRNMIIEAKNQGIEAGTFIMLGYPDENDEDVIETVNHLKISQPDIFTITIAYPIKGTGLFKEIEEQQINIPNWEESTDRDRDFKRLYPKRYYSAAVRWVVNEVNAHKRKRFDFNYFKLFTKAKVARMQMIWYKTVANNVS